MNDGVLELSKGEDHRLLFDCWFCLGDHQPLRSEYPQVNANFERHPGRPAPRTWPAPRKGTYGGGGFARPNIVAASLHHHTPSTPLSAFAGSRGRMLMTSAPG